MNRAQGSSLSYLDSKAKRVLDVVIVLMVLGPAGMVMLLIALAVLICDGRPVILLQPRAGRNGATFRMPKFRTMEEAPRTGNLGITPLGGFLRRHRLDELPQLFCVLSGRMSLVGPRPELVEIVREYRAHHRKRLLAKPGVTGIWQIKGSRRCSIHQQIGYDLRYLRKATLRLDLRILSSTFLFMVRPAAWQI